MIKNLLGISIGSLALFSIGCLAQTSVILPNFLEINPTNPVQAFPADIQRIFAISFDAPSSACLKTQTYMLTIFIYRNAVDNKFVAGYRPENDKETCWVNLISHSNALNPDLRAGGWLLPKPGANTWCSAAGLRDPNLCPIIL